MIDTTNRAHEFLITRCADGRWEWVWLVPMTDAALVVHSLHACRTKAGALRSAKAQTDKLRRLMVDLSRGDMV